MQTRDEIFIGGQWAKPHGNETIEVISPSTESVCARVPLATAEDVNDAVMAARSAFEDGPWPRMDLSERADYLREVGRCLENLQEGAVAAQVDEMGAPLRFIQPTTAAVPGFIERTIHDSRSIQYREERDGTVGKVLICREPVGVAAGVVPWNAPVMVAISKLAPSLLMGCPMVVKCALESPLSAYYLAEAIEQAGLPKGVVSIIAGGRDVGASLVGHDGIDKVTFTGSTEAGRHIAVTCGEQLKPVTLELGGKSAAIILEGVDMEPYLPVLVGGSIRNSGQICVSTNRVLVHESQEHEIVELISDFVAAMKVGDPHDPETDFGPLASARQRERVEGYIQSGIDQGAKIALGGGRPSGRDRGWYVEPTIFMGVENGMRIAQEEIFGPVLSVITYRNESEAIDIANDSEYGLGGVVFTDDIERGIDVATQIQTGTCAINDGPPSGGGGPFGGYKDSGLGRERGPEGLEAFLQLKSITLPADKDIPDSAMSLRK